MQKPTYNINKYKKQDDKLCKTYWQETAREICDEFKITGRWKAMIFRKAKTGMPQLKSNVAYCKERGIKNGRYLIAMFRK